LAETQQKPANLVKQIRERLMRELERLKETVQEQLESLSKIDSAGGAAGSASEPPMENVLAAVRNIITATLPEQVLNVLTEEAEQLGVRAAVFDVRGKAAWGSSARGFGPELSEKAFRTLAVPLIQETPFGHVYETCGDAAVSVENLKKNKNVLEKLKPSAGDPILLLPIRSTGLVSAIFYADPGGRNKSLPVNSLKILAEFAGAQLDRLMALSGGLPAPALRAEITEGEPVGAQDASPVAEAAPEFVAPSSAVSSTYASASPRAAGVDISEMSETDQKIHKDAKRFAKLLVSEIELYNKSKVADGRKNKDLYKRLKGDIDRSRQTYEKRFSKTVAKHYDYFHQELVRTLACADPSMLGSDYPGPSA
jgi:hypothetical protein